jgi:hypothetical protein
MTQTRLFENAAPPTLEQRVTLRIRALCEARGLPLEDLVRVAHLGYRRTSTLNPTSLTLAALCRISKALGVPVTELLE